MPLTLLHTSDWHIGKTIRGHSRAEEHTRALAEVAEIAQTNAVDLVLVAGDVFETAAPSPESEAIAWRALLDLADAAGDVVVIAGNHDNPRRLDALRDVMRLGNIHVIAEPRRPDDGGLIGFDINDCRVEVAALPFVSKRGIVRVNELMRGEAYEHAGTYAERLRSLIETLDASMTADIKIIMAHAFVLGGGAVGGERAAHLADEYALPAQSFPSSSAYVALGHLHKAQKVPGPSPIHYSGSLLQLDFGDTDATKSVSIVELEPGSPAAVTHVPLSEGRALRTVVGTLDELRTRDVGDDWLRVRVREARRTDLAEQVRTLFGERCVDVLVDAPESGMEKPPPSRTGRTPHELYEEYLAELGISDSRLVDLFDELHADLISGAH